MHEFILPNHEVIDRQCDPSVQEDRVNWRQMILSGVPRAAAGISIFAGTSSAQLPQDSISLAADGFIRPRQVVAVGARSVWVTGPGHGVLSIDLATGRTREVGRAGAGPGEYRGTLKLFSCDDAAGWLDDQLQRVTWISARDERLMKVVTVPSGVLSRGRVVDAWCNRESLWFSVERQMRARGENRIDSLLVFKMNRSLNSVDTVAQVAGTHRTERARGALRLSLRHPYSLPPSLLPGNPAALLFRSFDSVQVLPSGSLKPILIRTASTVRLNRISRTRLLDSIRNWFEDDMQTQKYAPALRREFRLLLDDVLNSLPIPETLPKVRMAAAVPGGGWAILENSQPDADQTCVSYLVTSGPLLPRRCFKSKDRDVADFIVTDRDFWVILFNDDDAWLQRISRR